MKRFFLLFSICLSTVVYSQKSISELLKEFNSESIPYITVKELAKSSNKMIILDAREANEFNISHLKNAINIGFDNFDISRIEKSIKNKHQNIVVYCSVGIRSEDIAEILKKNGYTNVYNLFGGIFEWKNNDYVVYDSDNNVTDKVHVFSEEWSQWLHKGKKVYD